MAIRVVGGFMQAIHREVRLNYGTHLYAACKGTPNADAKVVPYQPGYMLLAFAMGATLTVPPTVRNPVTGEVVANPIMEPGRVTAYAVCAARDGAGVYHVSMMANTLDTTHILRQEMLNIQRPEIVKILSVSDVARKEEKGELEGWICLDFMPGYKLCGDTKNPTIREAMKDMNNLSVTARQRAYSRAERLACDHNPVMRMSWQYQDLMQDIREKKTGNMHVIRSIGTVPDGWIKVGAPYVTVPVVAWVDNKDQRAMEQFVAALAAQQEVTPGMSFVVGDPMLDSGDDEIDNDIDEDTGTRQIAENPVPPQVIPPKPEPVPVVVAPVPSVVTVAAPVVAPVETVGAPVGKVPPEVSALHARCQGLINQLPPAEVKECFLRTEFKGEVVDCLEIGLLRRLQTELNLALTHLNRA